MSTTLVRPKKKSSRRRSARAVKPRAAASRAKKLDLDADEIALHAAISAAVARDLGR